MMLAQLRQLLQPVSRSQIAASNTSKQQRASASSADSTTATAAGRIALAWQILNANPNEVAMPRRELALLDWVTRELTVPLHATGHHATPVVVVDDGSSDSRQTANAAAAAAAAGASSSATTVMPYHSAEYWTFLVSVIDAIASAGLSSTSSSAPAAPSLAGANRAAASSIVIKPHLMQSLQGAIDFIHARETVDEALLESVMVAFDRLFDPTSAVAFLPKFEVYCTFLERVASLAVAESAAVPSRLLLAALNVFASMHRHHANQRKLFSTFIQTLLPKLTLLWHRYALSSSAADLVDSTDSLAAATIISIICSVVFHKEHIPLFQNGLVSRSVASYTSSLFEFVATHMRSDANPNLHQAVSLLVPELLAGFVDAVVGRPGATAVALSDAKERRSLFLFFLELYQCCCADASAAQVTSAAAAAEKPSAAGRQGRNNRNPKQKDQSGADTPMQVDSLPDAAAATTRTPTFGPPASWGEHLKLAHSLLLVLAARDVYQIVADSHVDAEQFTWLSSLASSVGSQAINSTAVYDRTAEELANIILVFDTLLGLNHAIVEPHLAHLWHALSLQLELHRSDNNNNNNNNNNNSGSDADAATSRPASYSAFIANLFATYTKLRQLDVLVGTVLAAINLLAEAPSSATTPLRLRWLGEHFHSHFATAIRSYPAARFPPLWEMVVDWLLERGSLLFELPESSSYTSIPRSATVAFTLCASALETMIAHVPITDLTADITLECVSTLRSKILRPLCATLRALRQSHQTLRTPSRGGAQLKRSADSALEPASTKRVRAADHSSQSANPLANELEQRLLCVYFSLLDRLARCEYACHVALLQGGQSSLIVLQGFYETEEGRLTAHEVAAACADASWIQVSVFGQQFAAGWIRLIDLASTETTWDPSLVSAFPVISTLQDELAAWSQFLIDSLPQVAENAGNARRWDGHPSSVDASNRPMATIGAIASVLPVFSSRKLLSQIDSVARFINKLTSSASLSPTSAEGSSGQLAMRLLNDPAFSELTLLHHSLVVASCTLASEHLLAFVAKCGRSPASSAAQTAVRSFGLDTLDDTAVSHFVDALYPSRPAVNVPSGRNAGIAKDIAAACASLQVLRHLPLAATQGELQQRVLAVLLPLDWLAGALELAIPTETRAFVRTLTVELFNLIACQGRWVEASVKWATSAAAALSASEPLQLLEPTTRIVANSVSHLLSQTSAEMQAIMRTLLGVVTLGCEQDAARIGKATTASPRSLLVGFALADVVIRAVTDQKASASHQNVTSSDTLSKHLLQPVAHVLVSSINGLLARTTLANERAYEVIYVLEVAASWLNKRMSSVTPAADSSSAKTVQVETLITMCIQLVCHRVLHADAAWLDRAAEQTETMAQLSAACDAIFACALAYSSSLRSNAGQSAASLAFGPLLASIFAVELRCAPGLLRANVSPVGANVVALGLTWEYLATSVDQADFSLVVSLFVGELQRLPVTVAEWEAPRVDRVRRALECLLRVLSTKLPESSRRYLRRNLETLLVELSTTANRVLQALHLPVGHVASIVAPLVSLLCTVLSCASHLSGLDGVQLSARDGSLFLALAQGISLQRLAPTFALSIPLKANLSTLPLSSSTGVTDAAASSVHYGLGAFAALLHAKYMILFNLLRRHASSIYGNVHILVQIVQSFIDDLLRRLAMHGRNVQLSLVDHDRPHVFQAQGDGPIEQQPSILQAALLSALAEQPATLIFRASIDDAARLMEEVSAHKVAMSKYAPYLIANYLQSVRRHGLDHECAQLLARGVYSVIDLCGKHELALLQAALDAPSRALFKGIYADYGTYHKYSGKY
ncbi:hypothetical protein CAOG_06343 [Capsaspora owczarzaki ATCC 30864]|uniref:Nucleolar 27S pre-rRNA processing Urb2/Npa2 C-terminal domain-containing protein n=1 Tax=Capsaspora owczarzaki (strain ATCC 30864) TaxID=595528 RepID=A0A0D2WTS1_CAPO3|nr:hypothetical protein CAOG_06343 [Capsaspora owczarzaki ATCC 30864]KJE95960.1 hypothetical protein CAOG_006343 [Capsaspora owczarzaki ATCC 30864]|eukprot:XP_004345092.2 hypothetical protein CAOG_06343 [Capsaspora owczarzaki ATCC 30864]